MKANELRIGNYVCWDIDDMIFSCEVTSILNNHISVEIRGERPSDISWEQEGDPGSFKPIPLTEEWLLKFGFNIKERIWFSKKTKKLCIRFEVFIKGKRCILFDTRCFDFCDMVFPKYVHQLQNLYFALTGEELVCKD